MFVERKGFCVPGTARSRRGSGGGWGKKRAGTFAKLLLKIGEIGARVRTGDESEDKIWALDVNGCSNFSASITLPEKQHHHQVSPERYIQCGLEC
jgi:hypothetical protein